MPDLMFDLLPYKEKALAVSEYILLVMVVLTVVLCVFHAHRWILFRRALFIAGLLYWCRSVAR